MAQQLDSAAPSLRGAFRMAGRAAKALLVIGVGGSLYFKYRQFKEYVTLPAAFYLELDFEQQSVVERQSSDPVKLLSMRPMLELQSLIQALHTAKQDDRVRGVMAVLGSRDNFGGMAQLQELRNALLDFRVRRPRMMTAIRAAGAEQSTDQKQQEQQEQLKQQGQQDSPRGSSRNTKPISNDASSAFSGAEFSLPFPYANHPNYHQFHAKSRAPIYAYSNVFGEGGMNGTGMYYLATAADKVFMPPTSCLSLLGFESTQVFFKGLLDKLKIQPQVFRREQYKAALSALTNDTFDPAQKENLTSLLQSLYSQVVDGIASARRISPAAVQAAINVAPLLPKAALSSGLVDGLLYRDQVEAQLLQQLPPEHQHPQVVPSRVTGLPSTNFGPRVPLQRYIIATKMLPLQETIAKKAASSSSSSGQLAQQAVAPTTSTGTTAMQQQQQQQHQQQQPTTQQQQQWYGMTQKPAVAVVTAAGAIMQAGSTGAAGELVESHKLVRALRAFRESPQVRAVVLRINSPGGSAVASDMIAREVQLLREAGKPVVACMADVAASGGYYIAAPANKILAQPGTITGSIGVIFAKFNLQEALQEIGVSGGTLKQGDNADWASPFHTLTQKQKEQVEAMIDTTYSDFLSEVSRGRSMNPEAVREVAKGRVWSGSQALEVGLVDELGGVSRAVELAKQLAGLPEDPNETAMLEWPPRRLPPAFMLLRSIGATPGQQEAAAGLSAPTAALSWLLEAAAAATGMLGLFASFLLAEASAGSSSNSSSWPWGVPAQPQQPMMLEAAAAAGAGVSSSSNPQAIASLAALAAAAARGGGGGSPQQQLAQQALLQLLLQQQSLEQPGPRQQLVPPQMLCLEAISLAYSC